MNRIEFGRFVAYKDAVLIIPFVECRGKIAHDFSKYKNNGNVYKIKWLKNAAYFNGISSYIIVSDSPSITMTNAVTILIWTKLLKHRDSTFLQKKNIGNADSDQEYALYPKFWGASPNNRFCAHINGTTISSGYYIVDLVYIYTWFMVGIRYAGDAIVGTGNAYIDFIINNKIVATASAPSSITNSGGTLLICEHTSYGATSPINGDHYLYGFIKFIIIYNKPLSKSELKSAYYYTKRNVKPTAVTRKGYYQSVRNTGIEVDGNINHCHEVI